MPLSIMSHDLCCVPSTLPYSTQDFTVRLSKRTLDMLWQLPKVLPTYLISKAKSERYRVTGHQPSFTTCYYLVVRWHTGNPYLPSVP